VSNKINRFLRKYGRKPSIKLFILVSDVDRVERFRLTLKFFDDVSTTS